MLGSASAHAIDEMLMYTHETQHEKIIRGLAMGLALVMYGREEGVRLRALSPLCCCCAFSRLCPNLRIAAGGRAGGPAAAGQGSDPAVRGDVHGGARVRRHRQQRCPAPPPPRRRLRRQRRRPPRRRHRHRYAESPPRGASDRSTPRRVLDVPPAARLPAPGLSAGRLL